MSKRKILGFWACVTMAGALGVGCSDSSEDDSVSGGSSGDPDLVLDDDASDDDSDGGETPASLEPGEDLVLASEVIEGGADALRKSSCAGAALEMEQAPVVLQMIIDVSGSMLAVAPGGTDSKWNVTRGALIDSLDGLRNDSSVGATFYPNRTTTPNPENPASVETCIDVSDNVAIGTLNEPGSAQRDALQAAFERVEPADPAGTPTHDAVDVALAALRTSNAPGNRYLLLVTDGQPTFSQGCLGYGATAYPVDEQPIIDAIAAAAADGIRTFVIGSPGSESNEATGDDARPWLSEAARMGGTATPGCSDEGPNFCHFDMTQAADFGSALSEALLAITSTLMCNYWLTAPPEGQTLDLNTVNLIYTTGAGGDEYLVVQNGAETCDLGWQLDSSTGEATVCGSTCDTLKADPLGRVELLVGCQAVVGPVQ